MSSLSVTSCHPPPPPLPPPHWSFFFSSFFLNLFIFVLFSILSSLLLPTGLANSLSTWQSTMVDTSHHTREFFSERHKCPPLIVTQASVLVWPLLSPPISWQYKSGLVYEQHWLPSWTKPFEMWPPILGPASNSAVKSRKFNANKLWKGLTARSRNWNR